MIGRRMQIPPQMHWTDRPSSDRRLRSTRLRLERRAEAEGVAEEVTVEAEAVEVEDTAEIEEAADTAAVVEDTEVEEVEEMVEVMEAVVDMVEEEVEAEVAAADIKPKIFIKTIYRKFSKYSIFSQ